MAVLGRLVHFMCLCSKVQCVLQCVQLWSEQSYFAPISLAAYARVHHVYLAGTNEIDPCPHACSLHCVAVVVRMWWCKCKRALLLEIHYEIGSRKHLSIAVIWFYPLCIVRSRNLWRELSSCYVCLCVYLMSTQCPRLLCILALFNQTGEAGDHTQASPNETGTHFWLPVFR